MINKKKILMVLSTFTLLTIVACANNETLKLKKDKFVVELGKDISLRAKNYLSKEVEKEILKNTKVSFKKKEVKEFPVGKYEMTLTHEKKKKDFVVSVVDTTAPTFVDMPKEIDVEQGSTEDLSTRFKAYDLSAYTIKVDTKKFDTNKVGKYKVKVVATDKHKNKVQETVVVNVKTKEDIVASNGNEVTPPTNAPTSPNGNGGNNNGGSSNNGNTGGGSSGGGGNVTPTPPPVICVAGTPKQDQLGNSGMWFANETLYLAWAEEYRKSDEYFNGNGFSAWTVEDTCGNSGVIWTIHWK